MLLFLKMSKNVKWKAQDVTQSHEASSSFEGMVNQIYPPGPGCSKLTTSLVNVSLKF